MDAISRPAVADEYGYVYDNTNIESEEYKHLINLLDPTKRMRDLLKEANNGEHPPTRYNISFFFFYIDFKYLSLSLSLSVLYRPPRLEFPSSLDLLFKHKYPQRLDYIFFMSYDIESNLRTSDEPKHTVVVSSYFLELFFLIVIFLGSLFGVQHGILTYQRSLWNPNDPHL